MSKEIMEGNKLRKGQKMVLKLKNNEEKLETDKGKITFYQGLFREIMEMRGKK